MELILGTRGSRLAVIQAEQVRSSLESIGYRAEIRKYTTSGDRDRNSPIYRMSRTGLFVDELNSLVSSGTVSFAVHSAKDIPSVIPDSLEISAVLPRASYRDVLVSNSSLETLDPWSVVGTSSRRRISELNAIRKDLTVRDIRGNIDTRIRKLNQGEYDGLILAQAAIDRMGIDVNHFVLSERDFIPSPNQGIIAVTSLKGSEASSLLKKINHPETFDAFRYERALMTQLKLGCSTPAGILCRKVSGDNILTARFYSLRTDEFREYETRIKSDSDVSKIAEEIRRTLPEAYGYGFGAA